MLYPQDLFGVIDVTNPWTIFIPLWMDFYPIILACPVTDTVNWGFYWDMSTKNWLSPPLTPFAGKWQYAWDKKLGKMYMLHTSCRVATGQTQVLCPVDISFCSITCHIYVVPPT
jgi:hypothetical protein